MALDTTGDLDANLARLFQTLKTHNNFSSEQLTVLRHVQAQLEPLITRGSKANGPPPLLPQGNQEYFKPKGAAAYLNSSTSTLAKRRIYGGGPKWSRIGVAVRYRKSDLDEWMAQNTVSSTSEKAGQ